MIVFELIKLNASTLPLGHRYFQLLAERRVLGIYIGVVIGTQCQLALDFLNMRFYFANVILKARNVPFKLLDTLIKLFLFMIVKF